MTEQLLTAASVLIEIGIPACLAIFCVRQPHSRPRAVVVLGATCPLLAFYIYTSIVFLFSARPSISDQFAFGAVWFMSAVPFLACVALGAVLSLIPRPEFLISRFLIGFVSPLLLASLSFL